MASSTARVLIQDALRSLGVVATGETPSADESTDALNLLNEMLEQWNLQRMLVYQIVRTLQSTTAGVGTYTLGSGGDWNMTRPDRIDRLNHVDSAQNLETPMRKQTDSEYQAIRLRTTQSTIPYEWYDDGAYPLRTITLFPVPSVNKQVALYTWQQLGTVNTLDTTLDFPPGYRAAVRYKLAIQCATDFDAEVSNALGVKAQQALAIIKRHHAPVEVLRTDPALQRSSARASRYDINIGMTRW